jgi:glycosyltransferase involved in cell wall biosynthesis
LKRILVCGPIFDTPAGPSGQGGKLYTKLKSEGYTVYKRSKYRNKILRVADTLFFVIFHARKYDIILIQMFSNMAFIIDYLVINVAQILNKKTIPIIRGGAFVEFYNRFPNWIGGVLRKSSLVSSPSLFIGQFLKSKNIEVLNIPNFIETHKFPYSWNPTDEHKLLWVRAFTDIYKPEFAIKTVHKLKESFPNIKLTMVGPDMGKLTYCKALINELGLNESIEITGSISNNELSHIYASHTIYINTTSYESFGVALIEAACTGIPVVSTDVGEIPFMWQNGEEMMIVKDNNLDAFSEAVKNLLLDKNAQTRLSKNARTKAEQFSWENVKPQWNKLLV